MNLYLLGGCRVVFVWCKVCFVLFRYHRLCHFSFLFVPSSFSLEMSLFPSIFVPLPFSPCMESTSYDFPFRMMVFFYLVTTGGMFDISFNVRIQSINQSIRVTSSSMIISGRNPPLNCTFTHTPCRCTKTKAKAHDEQPGYKSGFKSW